MSKMLFGILVALLQLLVTCSRHDHVHAHCIHAERQALLKIKQDLKPVTEYSQYDLLPSWGTEEEAGDCCKWPGVACSNTTGHVTMLDLSPAAFYSDYYYVFAGKISSAVAELRHLEYLDLSYFDLNSSHFPSSITSLIKLEYLNLSSCGMSGEIPPGIANLSRLEVLDLSSNLNLTAKSLSWVSSLSSLRKLDLSGADLSKSNNDDWIGMLNKLPCLTSLQLSYCQLPRDAVPSIRSLVNSSSSLVTLNLAENHLAFSLHQWNFSRFIVYLDLSHNSLVGSIPESIGNMNALQHLDLIGNNLEGNLSIPLWNLCELGFLDVSWNNLSGEFPKHPKSLSECSNYALRHMDISGNRMTGSLPDEIGQLKELEHLSLLNNFFDGVISEAHFSKHSKLSTLDISYNSITLNISSNWTPPFQLDYIGLRSCKLLNSEFPNWLLTQTDYRGLYMSNTGISGPIPDRFWGTISGKCMHIDLSNNRISGTIKSLHFQSISPNIDMSSNRLEGPVPRFLLHVGALNLSTNNFSDLSSLCDVTNDSELALLDISHNNISGELPDCWSYVKHLQALNLGNNWFSGNIPVSIGSITKIRSLHLGNNNFTGELPLWYSRNFSDLKVFDVGENNLSGSIPTWLAIRMSRLLILSLRSNHFTGRIPQSLCDLEKLQLLDLSQNKLSKKIPKCLGNLSAMGMQTMSETSISQDYIYESTVFRFASAFADELQLVWKGKPSRYRKTLGLVKVIDLSSNNLIGTIPGEITRLAGLVSLNLSRNKLSGQIPFEIGKLKVLDALDLSNNLISGLIPQSLSEVYRLNTLDLSNNNLFGEIPTSTQLQSFNATAYDGNPNLCGLPLRKNCSYEEPTSSTRDDQTEDEDKFISTGFYISAGLGITVGFWGVCGSLIFKRSWRYAYFKFFDSVQDMFYVAAMAKKAKLLRMTKR